MYFGLNLIQRNPSSSSSPTNASSKKLASSININYLQLTQKSLRCAQLQNTMSNVKQDLRELMRAFQQLKRENKKLSRKLNESQKEKESSNLSKSLSLNDKEEPKANLSGQRLKQKEKSLQIEEPLSISLEVHSKINYETQKDQPPYQNNDNSLKNMIDSLQKQISGLTRQNLQLKNTVVYYESRLQFVGQYLKKMEEQKEKEKRQAKQPKKQKRTKE